MLIKKYSLLFSLLLLVAFPAFATSPTNVQINGGAPSGVLLSAIESYAPYAGSTTFYTTPSTGSIFVLTSYSTNCPSGLVIGSITLAASGNVSSSIGVVTFPAGIQIPANTAITASNGGAQPCSAAISGVLTQPRF